MNLEERKKQTWDGMFYSIQRIDLLIISICGAGIYVCLETIKYLSTNKQECGFLIKFSAFMFLMGIILNFFSQQFGFKANEQDYLMCETLIEGGENICDSEKLLANKYDNKAECFSSLTAWFNYISMAFMFLGLITIFIYFIITF